MFCRVARRRNQDGTVREYLLLCETERVSGHVRQRVVANLGRLEEAVDGGRVDQVMTALARFSRQQWVRRAAASAEIQAGSAPSWGPMLVWRRLWEDLHLPQTVKRLLRGRSVSRPVEAAAFAMVAHRLCDPGSKLRLHSEWLPTVYWPGFDGLELHHLYRALDELAIYKDAIEAALWNRVADLFHQQLDLVFVDTTSTYWQGDGADGLAVFGHSKDHRPDRPQIVIGVLMTTDGIPVGHEVFPGNTADVKAFTALLAELKRRYHIRQACLVADRGMVSDAILAALDRAGYRYIVGERLRRRRPVRNALARAGRYRAVQPNLHVKNVLQGDRRYVVCYNPQQARHDARVRQETIARLRQVMSDGRTRSLVGHRGYRRYLRMDTDAVHVDEKALAEDARYDGRFVLRTNDMEMSAEQVARAYKNLWRIERLFRELKSGLDVRPMFHWTESRVRGHIFVCFLALVLQTAFVRRLREHACDVPLRKVLTDLAEVRALDLTVDGTRYLVRTQLRGDAYAAFQAAGLRPPAEVQPHPEAPPQTAEV